MDSNQCNTKDWVGQSDIQVHLIAVLNQIIRHLKKVKTK